MSKKKKKPKLNNNRKEDKHSEYIVDDYNDAYATELRSILPKKRKKHQIIIKNHIKMKI